MSVKPKNFSEFAKQTGKIESYQPDQIFHAQDFPNTLFLLQKGYVKRYQASDPEHKILELIYGPGHIISLSQLYKYLFNVDQNQDNTIYVYQAMTDVEMLSVPAEAVIGELKRNPIMYQDFFYESGLKLRSNIMRLKSNSIKDEFKKVTHQIMSLAYEFGEYNHGDIRNSIVLPLPHTSKDIAEQLNISTITVAKHVATLEKLGIITVDGSQITIVDVELLQDTYL